MADEEQALLGEDDGVAPPAGEAPPGPPVTAAALDRRTSSASHPEAAGLPRPAAASLAVEKAEPEGSAGSKAPTWSAADLPRLGAWGGPAPRPPARTTTRTGSAAPPQSESSPSVENGSDARFSGQPVLAAGAPPSSPWKAAPATPGADGGSPGGGPLPAGAAEAGSKFARSMTSKFGRSPSSLAKSNWSAALVGEAPKDPMLSRMAIDLRSLKVPPDLQHLLDAWDA